MCLVYCWFAFGLLLVHFELDWIGFTFFLGGLILIYDQFSLGYVWCVWCMSVSC